MFDRVYVEIGNICNLKCSFCPGTSRAPRQMSKDEFSFVCKSLVGKCEKIYLHVMGEPLLHPELGEILKTVAKYGFKACITTNGTLLPRCKALLLENSDVLHKVSISLHAPEGNGKDISNGEYLSGVIEAARELSGRDVNVAFRLWNLDTKTREGANSENGIIEERLHREYPEPWQKRYSGYRIAYRTFLEYDGIFTWPSESRADPEECGTCRALTQQIAILADGTVVPCCLDSDGNIPLGNIFKETFDEILTSPLLVQMREGFRQRKMIHGMCKKCVYAKRFGG